MVSRKTVGRLSLYRRLLGLLGEAGTMHVYSHQLAHLAGVSAAQVRRDFMTIGYSGSPNRGYEVKTCLASIGSLLEGSGCQDVALIGVGRLGRALLAHFSGKQQMLRIAVAFDADPAVVGSSLDGCEVRAAETIEKTVADLGIRIGILAVPPEAAQPAAAALVRAGVRSIVNFAAVPLGVPEEVFVDYMDITSALESAAFFAREGTGKGSVPEDVAETEMDPIIRTIDSLLARSDMKLEDLAQRIGARVLTPGAPAGVVVAKVYAGDRVSDLLNEASDKTLLVTNLANLQMVRVAELMDVPGICFVDGIDPEPDIIELARVNNTMILVSPVGVFETCGLIFRVLSENGQALENGQE
jgi:redox-sensing transcriptional repressor